MAKICINGSNNIIHSGIVGGNLIVGDVYLELPKFEFLNILKEIIMNDADKEQTILNMTESNKNLTNAIEKFAEAELLRAQADVNNSLANLNYSNIILEDRAIIKQMIDKLK